MPTKTAPSKQDLKAKHLSAQAKIDDLDKQIRHHEEQVRLLSARRQEADAERDKILLEMERLKRLPKWQYEVLSRVATGRLLVVCRPFSSRREHPRHDFYVAKDLETLGFVTVGEDKGMYANRAIAVTPLGKKKLREKR